MKILRLIFLGPEIENLRVQTIDTIPSLFAPANYWSDVVLLKYYTLEAILVISLL